MSRAMEIFQEAFSKPRDARSPEYRAGVLDVLQSRLGEAPKVRCPYEAGTAAADAYFSGCDEGLRRASEYLQKAKEGDMRTASADRLPLFSEVAINQSTSHGEHHHANFSQSAFSRERSPRVVHFRE